MTGSPSPSPGTGYVGIDGLAEPVRVRFTHVADADIAELVETRTSAPVAGAGLVTGVQAA